ncbi:hypothetical protein [Saccharopolyspora flava]|uniref:hypothetical protein n=1 Tax=Saccharopolyspora flava TaxID=95161 RepID=UPI001114FBA5|nr:hypothetical protein [Saccharopolyspora flava]
MAEPSSVEGLLEPAWQMRWRVPELTLVLSDRAAALARRTGDRGARLRAEALALFATNRLGRGVAATGRALTAVHDAETAGYPDLLTGLRIELGWCAVSSGSHEVAVRVLRRELARERIEPVLRAHALLALASALPGQQDVDERGDLIDEAERLYADCDAEQDTTRVLKARVWALRAAHRRRLGEFAEAVAATDTGLGLLRRLSDPEAEGGEIQTRLLLERVHALLDQGQRVEAVETSQAVLAEPVRAAAAGPTGWLGLALATRVHLPAGDHESALRVLAETAAISERHGLDGLLAEALNALSRAHEQVDEFAEALQALRSAYSADRRWRSVVHHARLSLLKAYPPETGTSHTEERRGRRAAPVAVVSEPEVFMKTSPTHQPDPTPEPVQTEAAGVDETSVTRHDEVAAVGRGDASASEVDEGSSRETSEGVGEVFMKTSPSRETEPESKRGGYAEAHDAARLLMEALTSRAAKESEEREAAEAPAPAESPDPVETPGSAETLGSAEASGSAEISGAAEAGGLPEPRVAFDSASPSEVFGAEEESRAGTSLPESRPAASWWPADEPERDEPDHSQSEHAQSDYSQPAHAQPDYAQPEAYEESGGLEDGYGDDDPAQRWSGDPLAAAADSLRRITQAHDRREHHAPDPDPDPEPVTPPRGFPLPEPDEPVARTPEQSEEQPREDEQEQGGRRSRGKSLAEIRAELQLPADHQPSRRRGRRHADPDPLAAFQPDPPAEPEPPAEPVSPAGSAEDTDPNLHRVEPEPAPPEPSADASLADLLADALMAYNAGRTDDAKQQVSEGIAALGYGGRHKSGYGERGYGDTHSDGDGNRTDHDTVGETGSNRHESTEDDRHDAFGARHRAPGIGGAAADPLL